MQPDTWKPPMVTGICAARNGRADLSVRRDLYFVRREGGPQYGGKSYEAIIRGEWKLMQNSPYQPLELYNLKADPEEMDDLYPSHPSLAVDMKDELDQKVVDVNRPFQRSGL